MKLNRSSALPPLLFLALALPTPRGASAGDPTWLSDVAAARERSRAEKKPIFAVFR
jgi:hypothetical protein